MLLKRQYQKQHVRNCFTKPMRYKITFQSGSSRGCSRSERSVEVSLEYLVAWEGTRVSHGVGFKRRLDELINSRILHTMDVPVYYGMETVLWPDHCMKDKVYKDIIYICNYIP